VHVQPIPVSVFMKFTASTNCTTYIITFHERHVTSQKIVHRMQHLLEMYRVNALPRGHLQSPFFIHCLLAHEIFEDGKIASVSLKKHLYDQVELPTWLSRHLSIVDTLRSSTRSTLTRTRPRTQEKMNLGPSPRNYILSPKMQIP
jgi:hypothetical protein